MGRGSSVGISTTLRAGRSGDRFLVGARFSAPVRTIPEAHPASYTMGTRSFPGVKRPGLGIDHPHPSSAEVKERLELYLCSSSGPSWPCLGWTLPVPYFTVGYQLSRLMKDLNNWRHGLSSLFCCVHSHSLTVFCKPVSFSVLRFVLRNSSCWLHVSVSCLYCTHSCNVAVFSSDSVWPQMLCMRWMFKDWPWICCNSAA